MKLKRLIAGALSVAMMLSASSMAVFAEDSTTDTASEPGVFGSTVTVDSTLNLSDDAIAAPNMQITYFVRSGAAETYTDTNASNEETSFGIYAGELAGVVVTSDMFKPQTGSDSSTYLEACARFANTDYAVNNIVTRSFTIDFSALVTGDTALAPGMYHYILQQGSVASNGGLTYEELESGLVQDQNGTRHLYVTILSDKDGAVHIEKVIMADAALSTQTAKKSTGFTNAYGIVPTDPTDPDDPVVPQPGGDSYDYIVTDAAFGTYADHAKDFTFGVTACASNKTAGKFLLDNQTVLAVSEDGTIPSTYVVAWDGNFYEVEQGVDDEGNVAYYAKDDDTYAVDSYQFVEVVSKLTPYTHNMASGEEFYFLGVAPAMGFTAQISAADADGETYKAQHRVHTGVAGDEWTEGATLLTTPKVADDTIIATTTKVQGVDFATVKGADTNNKQDKEDDDVKIEYTNDGYPDTGVILDFAPFILMVLVAGAVIAFRVYTTVKKKQ